MSPGTILFDRNFQFKDGEVGEKIFILLNNGSSGTYVSVKTTSNGSRYGLTAGCQVLERFPNFFIPVHAACLNDNTWVQLHVFYEFNAADLMQTVMSGEIHRIGVLPEKLANELISCSSHSNDITEDQLAEISP